MFTPQTNTKVPLSLWAYMYKDVRINNGPSTNRLQVQQIFEGGSNTQVYSRGKY